MLNLLSSSITGDDMQVNVAMWEGNSGAQQTLSFCCFFSRMFKILINMEYKCNTSFFFLVFKAETYSIFFLFLQQRGSFLNNHIT